MKRVISSICFLMILVVFQAFEANGQTSVPFTYQGSLKDGNVPANGNYEMKFEFFDVSTGGTALLTSTIGTVPVSNGIFSVTFTGDSGFMPPGASRWIQVSVRPAGSSSAFTTLAPRQQINYTPFAISSMLSDDSLKLGGLAANQFLTTTSGAMSFIQNTTTQQSGNFNINGNGTVGGAFSGNTVNAATQYNLGGFRVLIRGLNPNSLFVGFGAGAPNLVGEDNTFVGTQSGANTGGGQNTFVGAFAGSQGNDVRSSFLGWSAGKFSTGNNNSFFGANSGVGNTFGSGNVFIGYQAGFSNTTGNSNILIGQYANVAFNNLTNATAIGDRAAVSRSDSLILGSISGINGAASDANVGIGTTAPTYKLQVVDPSNTGLRVLTNATGGTVASFGGNGAFYVDTPGIVGGRFTILENGNIGFGTNAPNYKLHVVGQDVRVEGNTTGVFPRFSLNFTGGAADAKKWQNYATTNALVFSSINDAESIEARWMQVNRTGNTISGIAFPTGKVAIGGPFTTDTLGVNGTVSIGVLGSGGSTALCQNAQAQISTCSSSIRYKQNVADFTPGLDLVRRLRPVTFNWKSNNAADFGLVAEETAEVEPLLITRNDKGEIEGVKYDRVGVVLVNAVKEQQAQIETLKKINDAQQKQIDILIKLVCSSNSDAEVCQKK